MEFSSSNITDYLETRSKTKSSFQIFDTKYSIEEQKCIENFKINKSNTYDYCGHNNLPNIKTFLKSLGNNTDDQIHIIYKIIDKIIQTVLSGYKKEQFWLSIRVTTSNDIFNIPRWHTDGYFFGSNIPNQSKFVTVLKGPGTLLKQSTDEIKKIFYENQNDLRKKVKENKLSKEDQNKIYQENKPIIAEKLQDFPTIQLNNNQMLVFYVGDDNSAIHSEPRMDDMKYGRFFISILPYKEEDTLGKGGFKERFCDKFI